MITKILSILDSVSGVFLLLIVVLAPWMLGATTQATIAALNIFGFICGAVWLSNWILRRMIGSDDDFSFVNRGILWPMVLVNVFVLGLLFYVLCSALNPKAVLQYIIVADFPFATGVDIEYLNHIDWLPQTYDQNRTLRAFWKYLAISFIFFAARDWLIGTFRRDCRSIDGTPGFPGDRMQWLLWALAVNAAAVSLVGILQRLDGSQKLLWSFANHLNGGDGAFGPFPYRSSGAQYLNLMVSVR